MFTIALTLRYYVLLKEFTAKKLPEFYKKYSREQSSFGHGSCSAQYKDADLFPQTLPVEKFLDIPAPIRKRKFFEVTSHKVWSLSHLKLELETIYIRVSILSKCISS